MEVNSKVDSGSRLVEVPGLTAAYQTAWKIRLIQVHNRSLALAALARWERSSSNGFKSIMKGLRLVGTCRQPPHPFVRKSDLYDIHEVRPEHSNFRLLYFYDRLRGTAVCTNEYEAPLTEQAGAFEVGEGIRRLYEQWPESRKTL